MELAWFVGVDWGSQTHQACVSDVAGKLLGERAFEHGGQGLSEMADWILSFTAGKDSDRYKVAKCIQAEPVFCGFGRSAHSKVISVSVLRRSRSAWRSRHRAGRWSRA